MTYVFARINYNDIVTKYNTKIETIPSNIVASIFAFNKAELFKTNRENNENLNIKL